MRWELLVLEDNFQHLNDRISRGKNRCSEWGNEFFRSFHAILNNIKENNNFQTLEIGLLNESLISFHSISPSWCYVFHRKPSFKAKKMKRTVRLFSPGLSLSFSLAIEIQSFSVKTLKQSIPIRSRCCCCSLQFYLHIDRLCEESEKTSFSC